jgi:hypothetical protein
MALATPTIYTLEKDYARFGLTKAQATTLAQKKFANRSGGEPLFIVYHIQDGYTSGSLEYWVDRDASSTVMAQRDGSILKVIPEADGPWTNGDVKSPKPEAAELIAKPGNKNNWCLTIEGEGHPFDLMPDAEKNAIAWQTIDWMKRYPKIGMDQILRHGWINSVDRANCGLYIDDIKSIVAREIGKPGGTVYPDGMDLGIARMLFGQVVGADGTVYRFAEGGQISGMWLKRGVEIASYPRLIEVRNYDTRTYFVFSDGWTLWRPRNGVAVKELE